MCGWASWPSSDPLRSLQFNFPFWEFTYWEEWRLGYWLHPYWFCFWHRRPTVRLGLSHPSLPQQEKLLRLREQLITPRSFHRRPNLASTDVRRTPKGRCQCRVGEVMLLKDSVPNGDYVPCISLMKRWETSIRCQLTQALTLRGSSTCGTHHHPPLGRSE